MGRMMDKDINSGGFKMEEGFTYDGLGRVLSADKWDVGTEQFIGESDFSYNGFGLIAQTAEEILDSGDVRYINYEYDQRGDLVGYCYPDGSSSATSDITMSRDDNGRIVAIHKGATVANYTYDGFRVQSVRYNQPGDSTGISNSYSYNGLGWLTGISSQLAIDG